MQSTGIGGDFLGGAFYEKEAIQASVKGDVCGIMPETFSGKKGNGWLTAEAFAKSGKFSEMVVHMTPFDGSHKYPIEKLKPLLKKNALRLESLAKKYSTVILASPFCENRHDKKTMKDLFAWLSPLCPSCLLVNSSLNAGVSIPGVILEIHLESSRTLPKEPDGEYIISFDGFGGNKKYPGDFPDANIPEILSKYPRRRHARYWNARLNGKFSPTQDNPGAPNNRKHWPDVNYLTGHRITLTPRQGKLTWPNNALLKTFADDHGEGSHSKDNKLMFILPRGKDSIEVLDSKGTVIDKPSTRGLPPHTGDPKGPRYYSSKSMAEVANIAVKNTGSRIITVRSQKDTYPQTDVGLRSGKFKK